MTDAPAIEREPLYLSDAEIVRKMGLPINRGRVMLRALEADPKRLRGSVPRGDMRGRSAACRYSAGHLTESGSTNRNGAQRERRYLTRTTQRGLVSP